MGVDAFIRDSPRKHEANALGNTSVPTGKAGGAVGIERVVSAKEPFATGPQGLRLCAFGFDLVQNSPRARLGPSWTKRLAKGHAMIFL
jgi:hypothetical protein